MSVLNPGHLLDQAELLRRGIAGRKPRQVNLRRAVSSAYYAVFHHVITACADEFVGKKLKGGWRYAVVYRSVDHGKLKTLCTEALRSRASDKYKRFLSNNGFEPAIRNFSGLVLSLQAKRHEADYDPSHQLTSVDVMFAIYQARSALAALDTASIEGRKAFLTLLAFPLR